MIITPIIQYYIIFNHIVKYYIFISNQICYYLYMSEQDNKKMKTISFTLPAELLALAQAYAQREDRNLSSVIRLALKRLLESEQSK